MQESTQKTPLQEKAPASKQEHVKQEPAETEPLTSTVPTEVAATEKEPAMQQPFTQEPAKTENASTPQAPLVQEAAKTEDASTTTAIEQEPFEQEPAETEPLTSTVPAINHEPVEQQPLAQEPAKTENASTPQAPLEQEAAKTEYASTTAAIEHEPVEQELAETENASTPEAPFEQEPVEQEPAETENASTTAIEQEPVEQESIDPIFYVHIPKAGSSFATTLAHHGCGKRIGPNVKVREPKVFFLAHGEQCDPSLFGRFLSGHEPLPSGQPLRHVVTMLRDPRQRIMSGYYAGLHDCFEMKRRYDCHGSTECAAAPPVMEYAQCVENCTANMLTGRPCGARGPVYAESVEPMIRQLGYVGLTEEWELSVCLWHAKFGGKVLPAELLNLHPRKGTTARGEYDVDAAFGDWMPSVDTLLYKAAQERFFEELARFGVTRETCLEAIEAAVP